MKVVIQGTNNVNKGAELMFCAICQELEKRFPNSVVYISEATTESPYKSDKIEIQSRKYKSLIAFSEKTHLAGILRRIGLNVQFLHNSDYCPKNVDLYFNAGGYAIGDIWNHSIRSNRTREVFLQKMKRQGTKIIYLPQALGPFEKPNSKEAAKIILKYADMIYARENTSFNNLFKLGIDMHNVKIAPDFTPLIKGVYPVELSEYKDSIVVIPNKRMLLEVNVGIDDYVRLIKLLQPKAEKLNKEIVILNHEGNSDLEICNKINKCLGDSLKVISGLSSLETKGFIASAYAVISSRFHGTASSLSSAVPCISSSWSPKYELLYSDYGLSDMIVNLKDSNDIDIKISQILNPEQNEQMRQNLLQKVNAIKMMNKQMWNEIYKGYEE